MKRYDLLLPWPGVTARLGAFGPSGEGIESRLSAQMLRVHQSRCARALAVELFAEQGVQVGVIPKGPVGQPVWPEGYVGSLAHCEGFAAAVIASGGVCLGLGIDVEPEVPLPDDAGPVVLLDQEQAWVTSVKASHPAAGTLIFCAKECVHKALHPMTGAWLDFSDVQIEVDLGNDRFVAQPVSAVAQAAFAGSRGEGAFAVIAGHRIAALAVFAA